MSAPEWMTTNLLYVWGRNRGRTEGIVGAIVGTVLAEIVIVILASAWGLW